MVTMILYQRDVERKLFSLRAVFSMLVITFCLASGKPNANLNYFLAVLTIGLSLIRVTNLVVYPNVFLIRKYFFFGLIKISSSFKKADKIQLVRLDGKFGEVVNLSMQGVTGDIGCLFSILETIYPFKRTRINIVLRVYKGVNKIKRKAIFAVNEKEFNFIESFLSDAW